MLAEAIALDPRGRRGAPRALADQRQPRGYRVERLLVEVDEVRAQDRGTMEVRVTVNERRDQDRAACVDNFGLRPRPGVAGRSDARDPAMLDRHRLGDPITVERAYPRVR